MIREMIEIFKENIKNRREEKLNEEKYAQTEASMAAIENFRGDSTDWNDSIRRRDSLLQVKK